MALVLDSTRRAKQFYRHTFELHVEGLGVQITHTLLVNPEDFQMDEPARVNVVQTIGGAYVNDFGQGLPTVTISGTTGYRKRTSAEGLLTDGFDEFKRFRSHIYRGFIETNDPKLRLYWYNWEDEEYYEIQPTSFRLMRNKSEPLLYRYEMRFTCLRRLTNMKKPVADTLTAPQPLTIQSVVNQTMSNLSELMRGFRF